MKETYCDRCGKKVERPQRIAGIKLRINLVKFYFLDSNGIDVGRSGGGDLCEECAKELLWWFYKTENFEGE